MKKPSTKILSFRVPSDVAEKVDEAVKNSKPKPNRSQILSEIFIPAFNRYTKRAQKKVEAS